MPPPQYTIEFDRLVNTFKLFREVNSTDNQSSQSKIDGNGFLTTYGAIAKLS